jgi:SAM-dependent methyltransferase
MTHKNLNAYNGYELFYDYDEIKKYRQSKLDDCEKNLKFIKCFFKEKINILELGSGNSKLLYNLNSKNMLNFGYGFEISSDRFNFAENWKKDLKINNVKNICDNFLNLGKYNLSEIDLCYMPDLSFQFCEPISDGSEFDLLSAIYQSLKDNGKIIIELDGAQHFKQVRNWGSPEKQQENDKYKMKMALQNGYSVIRLLQNDVYRKKYDYKTKLIETINTIKNLAPQIVYICKNNEYDVFTKSDKIE